MHDQQNIKLLYRQQRISNTETQSVNQIRFLQTAQTKKSSFVQKRTSKTQQPSIKQLCFVNSTKKCVSNVHKKLGGGHPARATRGHFELRRRDYFLVSKHRKPNHPLIQRRMLQEWNPNQTQIIYMQYEPTKCTLFKLMIYFNYSVFDMFRSPKCSSSGRIVHAVLWYFFHAEIIYI